MKRALGVLLCFVLVFLCAVSAFAQQVTAEAVENNSLLSENSESLQNFTYRDKRLCEPSGVLLGIQNKGMWHLYPENSFKAISAALATGIDFVLVDVSFSKDNTPVLLEENAVFRMLGAREYEKVSRCPDEWLKQQVLKQYAGGEQEAFSSEPLCFLQDALQEFCNPKNGYTEARLILKTDAANADALFSVLAQYAQNNPQASQNLPAVWLSGKKAQIKVAIEKYAGQFTVITELRSNIVFEVTSFLNVCEKNGVTGVNLMTTNRYGVIFNQTVLKHRDGIRMISSTCQSKTAGAREDTAAWWDDLLSRGYSVIVTNDAEGFMKYKSDIAYAKQRLEQLYTQTENGNRLPEFKTTALNDYYKAYTDAKGQVQSLLGREVTSLKECNDAYAAYQKATDDIAANYQALTEGTAGVTVTLPRILLCVLAVVLVVPVQVFFFKRRKKGERIYPRTSK